MPRVRALVCAAFCLLAAAPVASGAPALHGHRGAPTVAGAHRFAEDTMPAFRNAWGRFGAVVEMDVKLTADRVPVVIHDATLDRVTACEGRVDARTFAELAACPVDIVGSPGAELGSGPSGTLEPIPRLVSFLSWARDTGPTVNLEIKNHPQEEDFDGSDAYAETVMDAVLESAFPAQRLIVQSFWPANLDVAKRRLPGVQTALLTNSTLNPGAPAFAQARDYTWVSPQWPVDKAFVDDAHQRGRGVVPYTLNQPEAVVEAVAIGVDAIITDDLLMARRALGLPDPPEEGSPDRSPPQVILDAPELASDAFRSPRMVLRWGAEDPSGIAAFDAAVRSKAAGWRELVANSPARSGVFTGEPGERYELRVRARDGAGNVSSYVTTPVVVPRDLRPRGWRRTRSRSAWRGTLAAPKGRRRSAKLRFNGSRLRLIAPLGPRGGRLVLRLDGRRHTVSLRGPAAARAVVFDSGELRDGRHKLRLRATGRVALDGIATR